MFRNPVILCIFLALLVSGCAKDYSSENGLQETGVIHLNFSSIVKDRPLTIGTEYVNQGGEPYTVTTFKYYIHRIALVNSEGKSVPVSSDYYLVDASLPMSSQIALRAPAGDYATLTFTLGVDSAQNVSGAQSGVLDPVNGMFWTWSSGYVMAKLEGLSQAAVTAANGNFTYHVGGYKSPTAVVKTISLTMPAAATFPLAKGAEGSLDITADIDTWFGRVNPIRIAEHPACHSPGDLAKQIADNYEGMFKIIGIR